MLKRAEDLFDIVILGGTSARGSVFQIFIFLFILLNNYMYINNGAITITGCFGV